VLIVKYKRFIELVVSTYQGGKILRSKENSRKCSNFSRPVHLLLAALTYTLGRAFLLILANLFSC